MSHPALGFALPTAPVAPTPTPAAPAMPQIVVQGTPSMSAPPIPMSGVSPVPAVTPAAAPTAAPVPAAQPASQAPESVFQGENVPPELRGATSEQVLAYYNRLRNFYFQQQAAPPVPQSVPAAAPQPAPAPTTPTAADFWSNPIDTIQQVVQASIAPVTQHTQREAIVQARNALASQDPSYIQHEQDVIRELQGVNMEALTNPMTWEVAYNVVLGRKMRAGIFTPPAPAPAAPAAPTPTLAPAPRFAPTTYFSEPAQSNGTTQAGVSTDSVNADMARKLGMTKEQYDNWQRILGGARG